MGDRFYQQQLERHGTCVGFKGSTRRRRMAWDEDKKQEAIDMYTAEEATPETSMEIVKDIAEELGESPKMSKKKVKFSILGGRSPPNIENLVSFFCPGACLILFWNEGVTPAKMTHI